MPKDNARWIAIGSGGDGCITGWGGEFDPVMRKIERYIHAIEEHRLGLNWKEVCAGVPALRGRAWEVSGAQPWEDFLESLEYCFDCFVCDDEEDDGMPGQSGHSFTIQLKASHRQSFLQSMEQLRLGPVGSRGSAVCLSERPDGTPTLLKAAFKLKALQGL